MKKVELVEEKIVEETIKLTTYVIIVSLVVGLLITGIDYLLNLGFSYII